MVNDVSEHEDGEVKGRELDGLLISTQTRVACVSVAHVMMHVSDTAHDEEGDCRYMSVIVGR
jgi:hypothetical protein